jgi:hypothetical protein
VPLATKGKGPWNQQRPRLSALPEPRRQIFPEGDVIGLLLATLGSRDAIVLGLWGRRGRALLTAVYTRSPATASRFRSPSCRPRGSDIGVRELFAPIKNGEPGTVATCVLGEFGLDLMAAVPAPHDEPDASCGGIAEHHGRAEFGLHLRADRERRPVASIKSSRPSLR